MPACDRRFGSAPGTRTTRKEVCSLSRYYPFLISIPHGGDRIPPEVQDRVELTPEDIAYNSDPRTREIYDFGAGVAGVVATPIARSIIDCNRAPYDLPPKNPDGVLKVATATGTPVYRQGQFPGMHLINRLLHLYYYPYHRRISDMLAGGEIGIAFDCHSMLPLAPLMWPDSGKSRPLICLGNSGNARGEAANRRSPLTCPPEWIRELTGTFHERFGDLGEVAINNPYPGGFIIRSHFRRTRIPWIQVEISRSLYEEFSDDTGAAAAASDSCDFDGLRTCIFSAMSAFWENVS
ncbi:MAG: N-formylglutamate amidohydrolase [Methanomicrobiaceae archaeon]|nr:N-formylglutamate amidohydrolase [Methanomicrobiaceae archaeon]